MRARLPLGWQNRGFHDGTDAVPDFLTTRVGGLCFWRVRRRRTLHSPPTGVSEVLFPRLAACGGYFAVRADAGFGPFVVLFGHDGAGEADDGITAGKGADIRVAVELPCSAAPALSLG